MPITLAEHRVVRGPDDGTSARSELSTRTPSSRLGSRTTNVRPPDGRKPRAGSSAYNRASTACPVRTTSSSCPNANRSPAATQQLLLDEVETGDQLGDRVFDLQPGVHLQEVRLVHARHRR